MLTDPRPRLSLRGITKSFPGVLANDDVSFDVSAGEIHALLGENGAGKSTLVKMIYGIMQPDAGQIVWNGQPVVINNPKAARRLGIGMVFQHFSLFEAMTVLENIALGLDAKIPARELEAKVSEVMAQYGLKLEPHRVDAQCGRTAAHRDRARPAARSDAADNGRAHVGADAPGSGATVRRAPP